MCLSAYIKAEREKRGWSQDYLGKQLGVTRAAVSLWESGGGMHRANVIKLSQVFNLTEEQKRDWLQAAVESGLILLDSLPTEREVPLMGWDQLHELASEKNLPSLLKRAPTTGGDDDLPDDAIAAYVADDSMEPLLFADDMVIFAKSVQPRIDDLVVVVINDDKALLRRYMPRGNDRAGRVVFDLLPTNPNYPTITSNFDNPANILGTVVERRLKRRK